MKHPRRKAETRASANFRGGAYVAAYVALHARRRPDHVAVLGNGAPVTYAMLDHDLRAIIQALRRLDMPAGAVAAIGLDDLYVQLLMVFGCEALGLVTASFRPSEGAEAAPLIAAADLVIAAGRLAQPPQKSLEITADWLHAALNAALEPTAPAGQAANVAAGEVIFRSSGTTGTAKRMLLSRAAMRHRLAAQRNPTLGLGLGRESRFLAVMHFAVGSTYMAAANLLRLGGTFMFHTQTAGNEARPLETRLAAYDPTHLTILPHQLRGLLTALPARGAPLLPQLTVQTIGAKLPPDLRRATLQNLAGHVRENYGANETGAIGAIDEAGLIHLFPGVTVEILEPDGGRPPPGEPGPLHIRTPGMVTAYLDDPDTTAAMFAGGAFLSGDIGAILGPATIKLVGRRADILNLGGTKRAAVDLEAQLLAGAPLADVALIQRSTGAASGPIIVCAVPRPDTHLANLEKTLTPLMPFPFRIRLLDQIPRTHEGKIRRAQLHDNLFRAAGAE